MSPNVNFVSPDWLLKKKNCQSSSNMSTAKFALSGDEVIGAVTGSRRNSFANIAYSNLGFSSEISDCCYPY